MTISVSYDSGLGSLSVSDYLSAWAVGFNTAGHGASNTGGFSNGTLSGDKRVFGAAGAIPGRF